MDRAGLKSGPGAEPTAGPSPSRDGKPCRSGLHQALAKAGLVDMIMEPMADTGLAHDHVWLHRRGGDDWVARLPKQSQMGLAAEANLAYQACCFARASASGHTPALEAILPPGEALPRGGLVVSAIRGRCARLPDDLPAIARALAELHRLPLPPAHARSPLLAPDSPWRGMLDEIRGQARFLEPARLDDAAYRPLREELRALEAWVDTQPMSTRALISFDAHPGNFLIDGRGRAVLVDLEKCRYGLPGLDLAHATLYTSTTWDLDTHAELDVEDVHAFYRHWAAALGDGSDHLDRRSLLQCRRAMWLWSVTWCAKWRVEHGRSRDASAGGEDWSAELSDPALIAHVRDRVDHYLSPGAIARVRDEWRRLEQLALFG